MIPPTRDILKLIPEMIQKLFFGCVGYATNFLSSTRASSRDASRFTSRSGASQAVGSLLGNHCRDWISSLVLAQWSHPPDKKFVQPCGPVRFAHLLLFANVPRTFTKYPQPCQNSNFWIIFGISLFQTLGGQELRSYEFIERKNRKVLAMLTNEIRIIDQLDIFR